MRRLETSRHHWRRLETSALEITTEDGKSPLEINIRLLELAKLHRAVESLQKAREKGEGREHGNSIEDTGNWQTIGERRKLVETNKVYLETVNWKSTELVFVVTGRLGNN